MIPNYPRISILLLLVAPMFLFANGVFLDRSSTPKMLAIVAGLCCLLRGDWTRKASAHNEVLAFLGVCLISAIFSADKWTAFAGAQRAPYNGLFPILLASLAYLGSTDLDWEEVDRFLVAFGVLLGGFAIAQAISGSSLIGIPLPTGRAVGFRASPVMMAASLIPPLLIAYHRARQDFSSRLIREDLLAAVIIAGGIAAAKAKGAIIAVAAGIWAYEASGAFLWAGLGGFLSISWWAIANIPEERERLELARIAWRSFKQHPVLGWGPDCFFFALLENKTADYQKVAGPGIIQTAAHNVFAQVGATLGAAGLAAFFMAAGKLLTAAYADKVAVAVLSAFVIQAQFNPIPVDILVMVAVVLGSRQRDTEGVVVIPRWVGPMLAGAAVVLAIKDLTPWARAMLHG